MGRPRSQELRALKQEERRELERVVKATSERVDSVKRAKARLAVAAGKSLTRAAKEAGLSREGVAQVVKRFNQRGLDILSIAPGRGRKPTYTSQQRARLLAEVQREPDRKEDQTATWSLMTLRTALRKTDLPKIAAATIRQVLHEAGYSSQPTRSWVRTGYALRKRKNGTVTTYDEQTPEKKDGLNWPTSRRKRRAWGGSMRMKLDPLKPSHSREPRGSPKATQLYSRTSTSAAARPNC